jgi:carbon storage regulator
MLVLSRKVNEQIIIGDDIIVTVVAIRGTHVRIGIEAPPNVSVHRREVYEMMMREAEAKKAQVSSGKPSEEAAENPAQS